MSVLPFLPVQIKSVSQTLLEFGKNELGVKIAFIATLYTWDQKLARHIHLYCVISGGALSPDKKRWTGPESDNFLFSVKTLSKVFRDKFINHLKKAYAKGDLVFAGKSLLYESDEGFKALVEELYKEYCKKPFAGGTQVLDYPGCYTFRTAISNERIKSVAGLPVGIEGIVIGKKRSPSALMNLSEDIWPVFLLIHIYVSDTMDFYPTAAGKKI